MGSSAKMIDGLLSSARADRDALLLAARELGRPVVEAVLRAGPSRRWCRATRGSGLLPASDIGSVMFSSALSVGIRL